MEKCHGYVHSDFDVLERAIFYAARRLGFGTAHIVSGGLKPPLDFVDTPDGSTIEEIESGADGDGHKDQGSRKAHGDSVLMRVSKACGKSIGHAHRRFGTFPFGCLGGSGWQRQHSRRIGHDNSFHTGF